MFTLIYRLMEAVDGEKGYKIIPYRQAEMVKVFCLNFINQGDKMQLSKHESDLYVLPETTKERHQLQVWKESSKYGSTWSYSDVSGQCWHGKQFLDIPFGIDFKTYFVKNFNITSDRT